MNHKYLYASTLTLCLLIFLCGHANASGFAVFTQGAKGLGQGNAVVAHSTGTASTLYFNPALLTEIEGTQIEVGTTAVIPDRSFRSSVSGLTTSTDDSTAFPSSLYFSHQINDQLSAGFGVYFPFGLSTEWPDTWDGRYIATSSDLVTTNYNPVVAWRPHPRVSIAAGLDIIYIDAELGNKINSTAVGNLPIFGGLGNLPDIDQQFEGDGWGSGFNLGTAINLTDSVQFGATYRSQVVVDVEGNVEFDIPASASALAIALPNTNGGAKITLPAQASFGMAINFGEKFTVEAGARWEEWSDFDELSISLRKSVLGQTVNSTPRDWEDVWAYNIGAEFQVTDKLTLLAGYLVSDNPVPESTFDPSIPDSDAELYTLGAEVSFGQYDISLAYGYEKHDGRVKNNSVGDPLDPTSINPLSVASGDYDAKIHLVGLSIARRF